MQRAGSQMNLNNLSMKPHAALYAAGLAAAWADSQELAALPHSSSYFTGPFRDVAPWSQAFEVMARICPGMNGVSESGSRPNGSGMSK